MKLKDAKLRSQREPCFTLELVKAGLWACLVPWLHPPVSPIWGHKGTSVCSARAEFFSRTSYCVPLRSGGPGYHTPMTLFSAPHTYNSGAGCTFTLRRADVKYPGRSPAYFRCWFHCSADCCSWENPQEEPGPPFQMRGESWRMSSLVRAFIQQDTLQTSFICLSPKLSLSLLCSPLCKEQLTRTADSRMRRMIVSSWALR